MHVRVKFGLKKKKKKKIVGTQALCLHVGHMFSVFLKSANFVSFTDKNVKCPTEIKILSVRMSDIKIQDVLHRIRTCLTENYPVWHEISFCKTECLTSLKSFQEVCVLTHYFEGLMDITCIASEIQRTAMSKQRKNRKSKFVNLTAPAATF